MKKERKKKQANKQNQFPFLSYSLSRIECTANKIEEAPETGYYFKYITKG